MKRSTTAIRRRARAMKSTTKRGRRAKGSSRTSWVVEAPGCLAWAGSDLAWAGWIWTGLGWPRLGPRVCGRASRCRQRLGARRPGLFRSSEVADSGLARGKKREKKERRRKEKEKKRRRKGERKRRGRRRERKWKYFGFCRV